MNLTIITEYPILQSLHGHWERILVEIHNNIPFLELDWVLNWWECCGMGHRLYVLWLIDGDRTVGFCPLMTTRRFGCREVNFIGYPAANYMDFLLRPDYREEAIPLIINHLMTQNFLINLQGIFQSSFSYSRCCSHLNQWKAPFFTGDMDAWFIDLRNQNFETYYKTRRKYNSIRSITGCEKKMRQLGSLVFEPLEPDCIAEIFKIHQKRWHRRDDRSGLATHNFQRFLTQLAVVQTGSFATRIDVLKLNGRIIGFQLGFYCNDRYLLYRIGHDPDFSAYAPGKIIVKSIIAAVFNQPNLTFFDFSIGTQRYKKEWTDESTRVSCLFFPAIKPFPKFLYCLFHLRRQVRRMIKKACNLILRVNNWRMNEKSSRKTG